jgi:hypothetical protein
MATKLTPTKWLALARKINARRRAKLATPSDQQVGTLTTNKAPAEARLHGAVEGLRVGPVIESMPANTITSAQSGECARTMIGRLFVLALFIAAQVVAAGTMLLLGLGLQAVDPDPNLLDWALVGVIGVAAGVVFLHVALTSRLSATVEF